MYVMNMFVDFLSVWCRLPHKSLLDDDLKHDLASMRMNLERSMLIILYVKCELEDELDFV